jgi:hypothetical protein
LRIFTTDKMRETDVSRARVHKATLHQKTGFPVIFQGYS